MKELPQPPPVYVMPKEMWFMRYSIPDGVTQVELQKACSAMVLTAYSALNLETPSSVAAIVKRIAPLLERFIRSHRETAMDDWRDICNRFRKEEEMNVEAAVINALKHEKQEN